ncbi:hypothetical protein OTU49_001013 [Cherax quadricarinatus]|uniref:Uncharacterized protein n=3 Tax=Cherax quadricarinatus TaxID=27406 RepID=A0AAW0XUI5_CHEQU
MGSPVAVLKGKGEPPPPRHSGDLPSTSLSSPPVGGGPSSMHAHTPRPQMPLGTYPPRLEQVQVSKNVVRVAASVQVAAASPSAVAASPSEAASLSEAAPPTEAAWRKLGKDSWEVRGSMEDGEEREVEGRVDGGHPDRSSLTLTPAASILVGCYARNSVGHIRIPCTYSITVVEPPKALTDCNVTMVGVTRMEVKCDDPAHARDDHTQVGVEGAHVQHSPSLSFVRSPQASSRANLEVWSGDTLVANVSEGRPHFSVRGLPPSTQLRLVLYTATPHARSTPLYMYTRTLPPTVPHFTVPPPTRPPPTETYPDANDLLDALGWEVVGGVGGVGVVLMLLVAVGVRAWARRRAAAETSESISNSNSLEEQQLHHPHHHPHHASLITTASEESMWGPEWRSSAM